MMTSYQADILDAMSYEVWYSAIEIETKVKKETGRRFLFDSTLYCLWNLSKKGWVEFRTEPDKTGNRGGIPRYYWRRIRNGKQIPRRSKFFSSLAGMIS